MREEQIGVAGREGTARIPRRAAVLALVAALGLSACGFQLRGPRPMPFDSLYVAMPESSELGAALKRNIRAASPGTRVTDTAQEAQAVLAPLAETREKIILSLNAAGRVREYQLKQRFGFHVHDGKGADIVAPAEIVITRDITFNDADILAKEAEETLIYRDMQNDLVQQILRRLQAAKPVAAKG
ncbi:MAG: LPS assembly lipoprotein LptE [Candidatus Methylophosphatis roskildensis]